MDFFFFWGLKREKLLQSSDSSLSQSFRLPPISLSLSLSMAPQQSRVPASFHHHDFTSLATIWRIKYAAQPINFQPKFWSKCKFASPLLFISFIFLWLFDLVCVLWVGIKFKWVLLDLKEEDHQNCKTENIKIIIIIIIREGRRRPPVWVCAREIGKKKEEEDHQCGFVQ